MLGFFDEKEPFQFTGKILTNIIVLIFITSIYSIFKGFKDFDKKFGVTSIIILVLVFIEFIINEFI